MRKRSCPAVSQICSFTVFPSSSNVRIFCKRTAVCMAGQSQKRSKRTDKQAEQMPVSVSQHHVTSHTTFSMLAQSHVAHGVEHLEHAERTRALTKSTPMVLM